MIERLLARVGTYGAILILFVAVLVTGLAGGAIEHFRLTAQQQQQQEQQSEQTGGQGQSHQGEQGSKGETKAQQGEAADEGESQKAKPASDARQGE